MIRHLKTALLRLKRSPYQALSAISIMTMSLFLAGSFFLLAAGSEAILSYFETRPQINAYFPQDMTPTPEQIDAIISRLKETKKTDVIKYVSKEEALKVYKSLNSNDPLLLEAVTASLLPASIEVTAQSPQDLKDLAKFLKLEESIEEVRYAEDVVGALSRWIYSVRLVGAVLVGVHILITFTVILLVVGIKVANRRDEIQLFQLVGATPAYISAPFIFEGIIYGVVGGFIAWGISYLIILYSMGFLVSFLTGVIALPPSIVFMLELLAGLLGLGSLVGGMGGAVAVHRFLKQ